MFNPFARSKNDLPSMNRHSITAWAHDIIDELQRIGTLNSGDEKAADDIFRVYQNILQFYSWVCTRPRVHVTHAQRPIQQPWAQNDIFASAHKVWSDLEWELRLEKDGAFVDQMIEHLGWFWNVKNNLVNQARHTRGKCVSAFHFNPHTKDNYQQDSLSFQACKQWRKRRTMLELAVSIVRM